MTLLAFADIFSLGPDDLGRTNNIRHEIDNEGEAPINQ